MDGIIVGQMAGAVDWSAIVAQWGAVGVLAYLAVKVLPGALSKYLDAQKDLVLLSEASRKEALGAFREESRDTRTIFREELAQVRNQADRDHDMHNRHHADLIEAKQKGHAELMEAVHKIHHTLHNHRASVEPAYREFVAGPEGKLIPNPLKKLEGG